MQGGEGAEHLSGGGERREHGRPEPLAHTSTRARRRRRRVLRAVEPVPGPEPPRDGRGRAADRQAAGPPGTATWAAASRPGSPPHEHGERVERDKARQVLPDPRIGVVERARRGHERGHAVDDAQPGRLLVELPEVLHGDAEFLGESGRDGVGARPRAPSSGHDDQLADRPGRPAKARAEHVIPRPPPRPKVTRRWPRAWGGHARPAGRGARWRAPIPRGCRPSP